MARRPRVSPEQILAVAAAEFAERGFAGARVDRIAHRARVNKAMLYYHFRSKEELYRTLLRRTFTLASERLSAIAASDLHPAAKMDRVVESIADFLREYAFFPAIMLREIAEGGARLDRETIAALSALPRSVAAIVAEGRAAGAFGDVHPLFAYFSMIAPIVFYLAGAPIRAEVEHQQLGASGDASVEAFVAHVQETLRRMLAPAVEAQPRPL